MSADPDVEEDHYATAANFGGDADEQDSDRTPLVTKVTVPESIKRRIPSKHYVRVIYVLHFNIQLFHRVPAIVILSTDKSTQRSKSGGESVRVFWLDRKSC